MQTNHYQHIPLERFFFLISTHTTISKVSYEIYFKKNQEVNVWHIHQTHSIAQMRMGKWQVQRDVKLQLHFSYFFGVRKIPRLRC